MNSKSRYFMGILATIVVLVATHHAIAGDRAIDKIRCSPLWKCGGTDFFTPPDGGVKYSAYVVGPLGDLTPSPSDEDFQAAKRIPDDVHRTDALSRLVFSKMAEAGNPLFGFMLANQGAVVCFQIILETDGEYGDKKLYWPPGLTMGVITMDGVIIPAVIVLMEENCQGNKGELQANKVDLFPGNGRPAVKLFSSLVSDRRGAKFARGIMAVPRHPQGRPSEWEWSPVNIRGYTFVNSSGNTTVSRR